MHSSGPPTRDPPVLTPTRPKWDTLLNRALNELKGHSLDQRPQYGHVHGAGDSATWKVFYNEGPEAKKQKKKFSQADIDAKVKLAVEKKQLRTRKKQSRTNMSCYSRQSMQL